MSKWDRRTYQATVEHDRYVRNADRERWLVDHPGVPFAPSMLTTAEANAETHIRRLHDQTWDQLRNMLILKWVLVALLCGLVLASGVPGLLIAGGALIGMGVHHSRERRVWHELHRPVPETAPAPIAADEARGSLPSGSRRQS